MSRQQHHGERERYSVREVSDLTGLAEKTVWRRIQRGELHATREPEGGRVRVWIAAEDVPSAQIAPPSPSQTTPAHDGGELHELRGLVERLRADVVTLRAGVESMRSEVRYLSGRVRAHGEDGAAVRPLAAIPTPEPPETAYSANGEPFPSREHAARWLCAGHATPAKVSTVKCWQEWHKLPKYPTPAQVWDAAASAHRRVSHDWRSSWALHRCGDPACACAALPATAPETAQEPASEYNADG